MYIVHEPQLFSYLYAVHFWRSTITWKWKWSVITSLFACGQMWHCLHTAGCYFGDPANPDLRVWMPNITRAWLETVDSQPDAPSLAGSLAHLLFTTEKMATQNATPTRTPGIKLLDDCTRRLPEEIVPSLGTPNHRRTPHWPKTPQPLKTNHSFLHSCWEKIT